MFYNRFNSQNTLLFADQSRDKNRESDAERGEDCLLKITYTCDLQDANLPKMS